MFVRVLKLKREWLDWTLSTLLKQNAEENFYILMIASRFLQCQEGARR